MTTNDKTQQLTPVQHQAIDAILAGQTLTAVAKSLDINRQTLSNWRNHDVDFQRDLESRQQDLVTHAQDELRRCFVSATERLHDLVQSENEHIALKAISIAFTAANLDMEKFDTPTTKNQKMFEFGW